MLEKQWVQPRLDLPAAVKLEIRSSSSLSRDSTGEPDDTWPVEEASVHRAVPSRVAEFRAGRVCARQALRRLGAPPMAIPAGADGAPMWPPGYVGSITHCQGLVAACAARASDVLAIGIDAEPVGGLEDDVAAIVLTPFERAATARSADPDLWTLLQFSAKESVFKAWSRLSPGWLDFADVTLRIDAGGTFRWLAPKWPGDAPLARGLWSVGPTHVMTAYLLTR